MKDHFYLLVAAFLWGLWGFFGKIGAKYYGNYWTNFIINIISAPMVLILLGPVIWYKKLKFFFHGKGFLALILATFSAILGGLIYYRLLNKLPTAVVVTITSSYPLFTVILAYIFLGEVLYWYQYMGILLVISGVTLLSL